MKHRLATAFGTGERKVSYRVVGEPVDVGGAQALAAESDRYQFQWWALGLVGARPTEQRKGADKGIDGRLYFHDDASGRGATKQVILSVKSGNLKAQDVRDLRGVVEREQAAIGVLLCMDEPTKAMRAEAASAGFYTSPWGMKKHPRLQILPVAELLGGKRIDMPPIRHTSETFKRAPKAASAVAETGLLPGVDGTEVTSDTAHDEEEREPKRKRKSRKSR
jgi:site-specific DNA-methyltransferase (adenine-specific)